MGVRLLYGLKTTDQAYLDVFYPSKRLREEAQKIGLDYQARIVPQKSDPGAVAEFCRGHAVLLRGELDADYYEELEKIGCPTVNPPKSVLLARDKLLSAEFFRREGFLHPRTMAINLKNPPPMDFPFILKPRYGKMGIGVALIQNPAEYSAYDYPGDILAQEYIRESTGRDIRFFFASFTGGDESSVCVQRKSGGLLSNVHSGAGTSPFAPGEKLKLAADAIFKKSGLIYGTVDFLFGKDDTFPVCELNSCPGFEGLESSTGINAARAILETAARMERR